MRSVALVLLFFGALFAKNFDFAQLSELPKSLAKDYYIYRFLPQANQSELSLIRPQIHAFRGKIKSLFEEKMPSEESLVCGSVTAKYFTKLSPECQERHISLKIIRELSKRDLKKVKKTFANNSKITTLIAAATAKFPAAFFASKQDADGYFSFFYKLKDEELQAYIQTPLPKNFADKIASHWRFANFISSLVLSKKNRDFALNFLEFDESQMSYKAAFSLGLLAILNDREERAKEFFSHAANATKRAFERDNAAFWVYLITNQEEDLRRVAQSGDVNIYTLYAKEALGDESEFLIASPLPTKEKLAGYDITDPFVWLRTKERFARLKGEEFLTQIEQFYTKETLGEYSYLMERFYDYKIAFFSMPHQHLLEGVTPERQALIYALMRQESRFVAGQVSVSYALGLMQFMPFLSRDIGKKLAIENFDEDDVFKPQIAFEFANFHLDYLEKFLFNPTLVAYAYNGGIGFTSRFLKTGDYFNPASPHISYEPFLSMELVAYEESKIYAKKVLANYVIYLKLLGSNASILPLLQNLMKPAESDFFRAKLAAK